MLQAGKKCSIYTLVLTTTLAIAAAALAPPALAESPQQAKPAQVPAHAFERLMTTMREQLALTPKQEQEVRPIFLKYFNKRAAVREQLHAQGPQTRNQLRKQMKNLRTEEDRELQRFLTPKQIEKLTALRAARIKKMRQRHQQQSSPAAQQQQ
jgi:Spy/CpxP family protein refolding chaperone